jgi:hypothetical protein
MLAASSRDWAQLVPPATCLTSRRRRIRIMPRRVSRRRASHVTPQRNGMGLFSTTIHPRVSRSPGSIRRRRVRAAMLGANSLGSAQSVPLATCPISRKRPTPITLPRDSQRTAVRATRPSNGKGPNSIMQRRDSPLQGSTWLPTARAATLAGSLPG